MHHATQKTFRRSMLTLALATYVATSVAASAFAQSPQTSARAEQLKAQMIERFQQADADKDSRLTKAETNGKMPRLHANFEKVDSDGDGYVTQQDIVAYMTSIAGQRR